MRITRRSRKLVGDRVELRKHSRRNYPLYSEWYANEEIWHLTSWASSPLSRRESEKLFRERESSASDKSFAIHVKGKDEPIGIVSLVNVSRANGSADLSIMLGPPESRRKGYGTEAIRLILDYAFEDLGLQRVGLSVFEFNHAAISVYRRLGFREEGRMRRAIKRHGEFYDAILMAVLKTEWESREG